MTTQVNLHTVFELNGAFLHVDVNADDAGEAMQQVQTIMQNSGVALADTGTTPASAGATIEPAPEPAKTEPAPEPAQKSEEVGNGQENTQTAPSSANPVAQAAAATPTATGTDTTSKQVSAEELHNVALAALEDGKEAQVVAMLQQVGASTVGTIPAEKRAEAFALLQGA